MSGTSITSAEGAGGNPDVTQRLEPVGNNKARSAKPAAKDDSGQP